MKIVAKVTLVFVIILVACGDDQSPTTLENLSGAWELTTTVTDDPCNVTDGGTSTETMTLIQCDTEVSVITRGGLWGSGTVRGDQMDFTGIEISTDETGCRATHQSTGTLSGTSTLLEGSFTTTISFDPDSCESRPPCTVETEIRLALLAGYHSSCFDRDEFGDPAASDYILPWSVGKSYVLNNGYCFPMGGHREQMAYDFLIPVGDTLVAAQAGVVRQIRESSPDNGQGSDHNHIMIEHADGTTGFYAHLKQWGVLVGVGEEVEQGQTIALAGHSGTTDVVHLHFGVYGTYPPVEGNDRAVNFSNMDGSVDCRGGLVMGETYTAR